MGFHVIFGYYNLYGLMVRVNPLGVIKLPVSSEVSRIPGSLRGLVPGLRAESGAPCGDGGDELLRGAFRVATLLRAVLKGGHPWVAKGRESMGRTWNHWNSMAGSDWNG